MHFKLAQHFSLKSSEYGWRVVDGTTGCTKDCRCMAREISASSILDSSRTRHNTVSQALVQMKKKKQTNSRGKYSLAFKSSFDNKIIKCDLVPCSKTFITSNERPLGVI
ncbi:hypothetical protein CBL_06092 [Carabus blaptoides fortunei]